jgi:DNA-directed RNA polymerase subunit M/transcription elongation factor TFIIS
MYYISLDPSDNNKLIYYCRNCGHQDETISVDSTNVSQIHVKRSEQEFRHFINKYTKFDPTLPRVNNIKCPNPDCGTNTKDEPREIIYMRYDDINMKYIYICSTCDIVWKAESQSK